MKEKVSRDEALRTAHAMLQASDVVVIVKLRGNTVIVTPGSSEIMSQPKEIEVTA